MNDQLLYKDLAKYYDLIYSFKDYQKESDEIKQLIKEYKKSSGNNLLDVACGSGKHLEYLQESFECIGVDVNKQLLDEAKKRLPNIDFKTADMTQLNLGRQFDVITCLFSSIGYVKTIENLEKTIQCFANHLVSGGIVIIEPWIAKGEYIEGTPHMQTYSDAHVKIARLNVSKIENGLSILNFHYLIAEEGTTDVTYFTDRHELGLFTNEETIMLMEKAGLVTYHLTNGIVSSRGIFIGVKA